MNHPVRWLREGVIMLTGKDVGANGGAKMSPISMAPWHLNASYMEQDRQHGRRLGTVFKTSRLLSEYGCGKADEYPCKCTFMT